MRIVLVDTTTGRSHVLSGFVCDAYMHLGFSPGDDVAWVSQEKAQDGRRSDPARLFRASDGTPLGPVFTSDFRLFRSRGKTVWMTFPHPNGDDVDAGATFRDVASGAVLDGCEPDLDGGSESIRFDGQSLVTLGRDGLVRWWSPTTGKQTRPPSRPSRGDRHPTAALLGNGRTAVLLGTDGRLGWFDLTSRRQHPISVTAPPKPDLAMRPDGTSFLLGAKDQPLRLFRLGCLPPCSVPAEARARYDPVAVSPDLKHVYAGWNSSSAAPHGLLRRAEGDPVCVVPGPAVSGPVFSHDGTLLATHSPQLTGVPPVAHVVDTRTGQLLGEFRITKYIHGLAFNRDNNVVAVGHVGGTYLWRCGQPSTKYLPQRPPVSELLFSPDPAGKWLVTGGRAGWPNSPSCFQLWETATGNPVGPSVATNDAPRLAFRPDGKVLYTLEMQVGLLRRWEVDGGLKRLGEDAWLSRDIPANRAVFSADTGRLMTGYPDGRVRLWSTDTGAALGGAISHPASVTALAWAPDATHLAVGCEDGTVWLRDAGTGLALGPPTLHRAAVHAVTFSPDGKALLSVSTDGVAIRRRVPVELTQPVAVLEDWFRAGTGVWLDGEGVIHLDLRAWEQARQRLKADWPEALTEFDRPTDLEALGEARLRDAEADGIGHRWELNRAIEREAARGRDGWLARVRQAHLDLQENRPSEAAQGYKRVEALGTGRLLAWYAQREAEARAGGRWSIAHWYLDHLLAARPQDWRLYQLRAMVRSAQGRKEEARADQLQAANRGADHPFLLSMVDQMAEEGDWEAVTAWLARDVARWGFSLGTCERQALVALRSGRMTEYCKARELALSDYARRLGGQATTFEATFVCFLCTLGPDPLPPDAALGRSLERWSSDMEGWLPGIKRDLLESSPHVDDSTQRLYADYAYRILYARAAALHRTGQHAAALERLRHLDAVDREDRGWHRPLLALVHQRLNNSAEARHWVAESRKWLASHPAGKRPWEVRLIVRLLLDEAIDRLEGLAELEEP